MRRPHALLLYLSLTESHRFAAEMQAAAARSQTNVDADLHESPRPGYVVLDGRVSWTLRRFRLTTAVNNLAGVDYYAHLSYQRDPFRSGFRVHEPGGNFYLNFGFGF